jgi:hypothetical protein
MLKINGREIPTNAGGDPNFETIEEITACFDEQEVVRLVNKALYTMLYQREAHKKRAARERALMSPVKKKVRELFGTSFAKATEEQVEAALKACKSEKEEK